MSDMLAAYGYSAECAGCRHKRSGFTGARDHTDACRSRIAESIRADISERGSRFKVCVSRAQVRLGHSKESQDAVLLADGLEKMEEVLLFLPNVPRRRRKQFWMRWKTTRKQDLWLDVVEMYSPPRTTPVAKRMGLVAGQALDLRTGWDFRLSRHKAALRSVRKVRPKLVIGSPGCTVFSQLQNLCGSHWDRNRRDRLEKAQNHMRFIVEVYWEQVNHGLWFLHEHSWERSLGSWMRSRSCRVRQGYALQSQINASMV